MKLKEIRPLLAGKMILYEEADQGDVYNDIFKGDRGDIPEEMLEREVVVIGTASTKDDVLDIELKRQ